MNWDAIGAVGEIFGAGGVIVSLIYLSLQIKKSDKTARAESLRAVLEGFRDRTFLQGYTNPAVPSLLARGLTSLKSLTPNEKRQLFYLLGEQIFQMQQTAHLHEAGLIPKEDYDAWLFYTASLFKTPGGAELWALEKALIAPTIGRLITNYLDDHPDMPSFLDVNPLFFEDGEGVA